MDWIEVGPNFWNLRSSFYFLLGTVDIGTHCSLIKLPSGKFILIDTVKFSPKALRELNELTSNGTLIDAVIASHPFHTVYFASFYKLYPNLTYYGTPRHIRRGDGVGWSSITVDQKNFLEKYESQGVFMRIPDGAEFVDPVEGNHFSSVFVFHAESRTIHVDDTILYADRPGCILRCAGHVHGSMTFWDLRKGLHPSEEAPLLFKSWFDKLLTDWDFDNIVTAHMGSKIGGAKLQITELFKDSSPVLEKMSRERSLSTVSAKQISPLK